jgi:hypothetical protein
MQQVSEKKKADGILADGGKSSTNRNLTKN